MLLRMRLVFVVDAPAIVIDVIVVVVVDALVVVVVVVVARSNKSKDDLYDLLPKSTNSQIPKIPNSQNHQTKNTVKAPSVVIK